MDENIKVVLGTIEKCLEEGYAPPYVKRVSKKAIQETSKRLGLSTSTIHDRLKRARNVYGLEPRWSLYSVPTRQEGVSGTPDSQELKDLRKQLEEAYSKIDKLSSVRDAVFGLTEFSVEPPAWQLEPAHHDNIPEVPVLFTSDFQWGEVINSVELEYDNEYSPEVASRRYRTLVDRVIDLCFNHEVNKSYPGIVYLRGGDSISGAIHEDLAETQYMTVIEQTKAVASEEIAGIEKLANKFGNVVVWSIPGNHSRTTKKIRAKRYVSLDYDDLAVFSMEHYFRNDKRVTFRYPRSGDAYFKIYNHRFLMTHGDRIGAGGGTGFIGPAATILKGVYKIRQQYARMGKYVDTVLLGHYHVPMELPNAIVNGTLAGFSEYAKYLLRVEPEPPSQTLFFVHPKWGITHRRKIYVENPPNLGGAWHSEFQSL